MESMDKHSVRHYCRAK